MFTSIPLRVGLHPIAYSAAARPEAMITKAVISQANSSGCSREQVVYSTDLEKRLPSATASRADPEDACVCPPSTLNARKRVKESASPAGQFSVGVNIRSSSSSDIRETLSNSWSMAKASAAVDRRKSVTS